jgi:hypothetical protein
MSKKGTALLSGAHHQSFRGTDFRTAGNDMYMPTFNLSFNTGTLSVATSPTDPDPNPESSTPKQRRSRFFQQAFRIFRSPEFRDALVHQPGEAPTAMERREPARVGQPAPNPPSQQGSTSAAGCAGGEAQMRNEEKEGDFNVVCLLCLGA